MMDLNHGSATFAVLEKIAGFVGLKNHPGLRRDKHNYAVIFLGNISSEYEYRAVVQGSQYCI